MDELQALTNTIVSGYDIPEGQDYDRILAQISEIVYEMLDNQQDLLFSYLYRLDVDENQIKMALHHANTSFPHTALAKLILDRQIQRLKTRKQYKNPTRKLS